MVLSNFARKKISAQSLSAAFLLFSLFFVPINYDISGLRVSDVFILVSFVFFVSSSNPRINKNFLCVFSLLFVVLIFSALIRIYFYPAFQVERVIFVYKYLSFFIVASLGYYHFSATDDFIISFRKVLFYVHLSLALWVFVYQYLVFTGILHGSFRPSFPLSRDYEASDAHLYSAVLGFLMLFYILHLSQALKHNVIAKLIFCLIFFGALVLTGSRGGIILLILGLFIFTFVKACLQRKFLLKVAILSPFLFSFLLFALYTVQVVYLPDIDYDLVSRAFNFDFSNDQSSLSRIQKFETALTDLHSYSYLVGAGFLHSSLDWYDGFLSILLAHGGFIALFLFMVVASITFLRISYFDSSLFALCASLFLSYLFINFVTEYVLVYRNMMPCLMILTYCFFLGIRKKSCDDLIESRMF